MLIYIRDNENKVLKRISNDTEILVLKDMKVSEIILVNNVKYLIISKVICFKESSLTIDFKIVELSSYSYESNLKENG